MADISLQQPYRILSLDGGGAKGFYTLGVLREIEGLIQGPIHEKFDLIFGTSTGAIIAALLALGNDVSTISALYKQHVPTVMKAKSAREKSQALASLASEVFGDHQFDQMKTAIGIVATKWVIERPMIFKASIDQAHGRKGTFAAGFGVAVADAVQASCSAYPFFERKVVTTHKGEQVELIDGGYCANNPTLYAIADALAAVHAPRNHLRVVSLGVGVYPPRQYSMLTKIGWMRKVKSVQLLQKTLEINTQSMDQLRHVFFGDVPTLRISDTFEQPEMATDLFEHDMAKLNLLTQRGGESFAKHESTLRDLLL